MKLLRRLVPFTSTGGAAWYALRHRRPLWDWGTWTLRSVPRAATGEIGDVWTEARLRRRLRDDEDIGEDRIDVRVSDGCAVLRGEVPEGGRAVASALARGQRGVDAVHDQLKERTPQPAAG